MSNMVNMSAVMVERKGPVVVMVIMMVIGMTVLVMVLVMWPREEGKGFVIQHSGCAILLK